MLVQRFCLSLWTWIFYLLFILTVWNICAYTHILIARLWHRSLAFTLNLNCFKPYSMCMTFMPFAFNMWTCISKTMFTQVNSLKSSYYILFVLIVSLVAVISNRMFCVCVSLIHNITTITLRNWYQLMLPKITQNLFRILPVGAETKFIKCQQSNA